MREARIKKLQNQRGDTLIEVIIATVIIGVVLLSAYTLGSKAFQLGRSARERSQAIQLLQAQAEGLTALRNKAASWQSFCARLKTDTSNNLDQFHLRSQGSPEQWQLASGDLVTNSGTPDASGLYTVSANAGFVGVGLLTPGDYACHLTDKVHVTLQVVWNRFGGGPQETSTLYVRLANRELP